ncbi:FAD dependent oxidoreductase [Dentipellis sp. KUC8613]|nr:FAD dependent oxidoreductase [Dentipellis sp. KUC8613]
MSSPKNIVIIGGGIIGCTTAFYLSRHPSNTNAKIIVLEASKLGAAQGASGKAGGLIAKWAYPKELAKFSFEEHLRLAEEFGGTKRWGFRLMHVGEWEGRSQDAEEVRSAYGEDEEDIEPTREEKGLPPDLNFMDESLSDSYTPMAPTGDTAQVHPYFFTSSMLRLAMEKGVEFIKGRVVGVDIASEAVTGVRYVVPDTTDEISLPADTIILAAGPWSTALIPSLPITSTRAHSIVIRPPPSLPADAIPPYALFASVTLGSSPGPKNVNLEIYPRADPTIYVCGPGDSKPLPRTVDDVVWEPSACEDIWKWVSTSGIVKSWALGKVVRQQACYLANVQTGGGPIIGEVTGIKGLIVATGHTCWGISNATGTGKAVSELVLEGKIKSMNLSRLAPGSVKLK